MMLGMSGHPLVSGQHQTHNVCQSTSPTLVLSEMTLVWKGLGLYPPRHLVECLGLCLGQPLGLDNGGEVEGVEEAQEHCTVDQTERC